METFTASNGMQLRTDEGGWLERCNRGQLGTGEWGKLNQLNAKAPSLVWDALREFFLHERDQELGRWRSNKHPDVVAYPLTEDLVRVFNEVTGNALGVSRGERDSWSEPGEQVGMLNSVGDEYFAAHPVPKPWHAAQPGEAWVITYGGEEYAVISDGAYFLWQAGSEQAITDSLITDAHRIWPEVPSE